MQKKEKNPRSFPGYFLVFQVSRSIFFIPGYFQVFQVFQSLRWPRVKTVSDSEPAQKTHPKSMGLQNIWQKQLTTDLLLSTSPLPHKYCQKKSINLFFSKFTPITTIYPFHLKTSPSFPSQNFHPESGKSPIFSQNQRSFH